MPFSGLKAATLLAGLAGACATPGVAQAQFYFDTWGGRFEAPLNDDYGRYDDRSYRDYDRSYREAAPLARREIAAVLSRRGYRVNPSIARNDDVYLVDAVDPSGRRLRLVVDAYDASILERFPAAAPRDSGPRVIPGLGPKKPATARVEPRAPIQKQPETRPAPAPAAPPPTAPAPATPGPAAHASPPAEHPAAAARVIPLYKTPETAVEKPSEGPP